MNKIISFVLFIVIPISFIQCRGIDPILTNYETEKIIISTGDEKSAKMPLLTFNSSDKNLVSLCFLDKFNDTILLYLNKKKVIAFDRNDSLSYKNLNHSEIFKFVRREKRNDRITIFLKKSKKQISFDLIDEKNMYLISYYGSTWYLTTWK